MAKINVALQIYLQADSEDKRRKLADEVEDQLRLLSPIESCEKKPYWKIPDNYGVYATFTPVEDPVQLFQKILAQSEHGWTPNVKRTDTYDLYAEAIWNHKPDVRLLLDCVQWAHLLYISVADNLRFSLDQPVRMIGTSPKTEKVHGMIGTISALPSTDDDLSYAVFFPEIQRVWCISSEELEAVD